VDDERIRQLTAEVLNHLRGTTETAGAAGLESRVAALEAAVARLERAAVGAQTPAAEVHVHTHPSLRVLAVPGGSDRCLMEPDKPCVQSQACRVLGH
jgi:hypothetical protein